MPIVYSTPAYNTMHASCLALGWPLVLTLTECVDMCNHAHTRMGRSLGILSRHM